MAYYNRGLAYKILDQYHRAFQDYNKAIQLDPGFAMTFYNRGFISYSWGQYANADADKAKACRLDSQ